MDLLHPERGSDYEQRDWSELSSDLLHLVSRKLPDVFDFVRFRAVCKHWRYAAPTSDHHPLLPCLFGQTSKHFLIYSLRSGKIHKLEFSDPQENIIVPEYFGPTEYHILVGTVGSDTLTLINPLTNKKVILPPVNHKCCMHSWIGMNPTKRWEHVAVNVFEENSSPQYLALYRHNEGNWVTIRKDMAGRFPLIYHRGTYYFFVEKTKITEVIDATVGELRSTVPPPKSRKFYYSYRNRFFIESSGELLLVCQFTALTPCSGPELSVKYDFEIYQLNQENEDLRWERVSEIADQALFLGNNGGFSVRATDFDRFKGNCIYYIDFPHEKIYGDDPSPPRVTYMLRYDINDGSCEQLSYPFNEAVNWILPTLQ